jgi:hypothetical protein
MIQLPLGVKVVWGVKAPEFINKLLIGLTFGQGGC